MTFAEYQRWVSEVRCFSHDRDRLFLGPLGLNGEAGEVSEILKKHLIHGKELNLEHLSEEMGDVLWYFALICANHGLDFEGIMEQNVTKLVKRHGGLRPEEMDAPRLR